jgi:hypothetical protein
VVIRRRRLGRLKGKCESPVCFCYTRLTEGGALQFKVPQNIDLQDKIIGPLTLVQFTVLVVSGLVFYATLRFTNLITVLVVGTPILLLGIALSIVKIQDQPFSHFLIASLGYFWRPKLRVWQKDPTLERLALPTTVNPLHRAEEQAATAARQERREQTMSQLDQLARLLDTRGEDAVEAIGGITAKTLNASQPPASTESRK